MNLRVIIPILGLEPSTDKPRIGQPDPAQTQIFNMGGGNGFDHTIGNYKNVVRSVGAARWRSDS